jgi:pimeloyl-ACP methyl ester carboxylesterase
VDPAISSALDAWRRLYGGELHELPPPAPGSAAVAVRRGDFRRDPGNWPAILHHRRRTDRVLVLIHGLKDSPGYLRHVAGRFAARGVNVVLPLLPGHGRRRPVAAMRRAGVSSWRASVDRAVEVAAALGDQLSIGGLSTGGALALDACLRHPPAVGGKLFLFAAALGLTPLARRVLSIPPLPHLADAWHAARGDDGIGGNPLKYSRDFLAAGRQVLLLIRAIRRAAGESFVRLEHRGRVFVAHSEADRTIPVGAVLPLVERGDAGQHHLIPEALDVGHAELVMAEAMTYAKRRPGEPDPPRANPEFEPMMAKALEFLER